MILYLDASSLVKLYVEEVGSQRVRQLASQAYALTTCWLAYTEACSAFARKLRDRAIDMSEYQPTLKEFERDWSSFLALPVSEELLVEAGRLSEKHALRALDLIHLASALYTAGSSLASTLVFSSADTRLLEAAQAEGLTTQLG